MEAFLFMIVSIYRFCLIKQLFYMESKRKSDEYSTWSFRKEFENQCSELDANIMKTTNINSLLLTWYNCNEKDPDAYFDIDTETFINTDDNTYIDTLLYLIIANQEDLASIRNRAKISKLQEKYPIYTEYDLEEEEKILKAMCICLLEPMESVYNIENISDTMITFSQYLMKQDMNYATQSLPIEKLPDNIIMPGGGGTVKNLCMSIVEGQSETIFYIALIVMFFIVINAFAVHIIQNKYFLPSQHIFIFLTMNTCAMLILNTLLTETSLQLTTLFIYISFVGLILSKYMK